MRLVEIIVCDDIRYETPTYHKEFINPESVVRIEPSDSPEKYGCIVSLSNDNLIFPLTTVERFAALVIGKD